MRMRHRVTFKYVNSDVGAEVVTFDDFATGVPANITPVGGGESNRGPQLEANVTHQIECRFAGTYTPSMKIVNEETSDEYDIIRIINKDGRRRRHLILVNEVVE